MNREQQIDEEIKALRAERELLRSRKMLTCSCGKRSQISKWILISDYHYVRPYSCSGGDYWTFSNEYHAICPKCQGVGRVYEKSWAKTKEENALYEFVSEHERYFGEHLRSYDDGYDVKVLRQKQKEREERRRSW